MKLPWKVRSSVEINGKYFKDEKLVEEREEIINSFIDEIDWCGRSSAAIKFSVNIKIYNLQTKTNRWNQMDWYVLPHKYFMDVGYSQMRNEYIEEFRESIKEYAKHKHSLKLVVKTQVYSPDH